MSNRTFKKIILSQKINMGGFLLQQPLPDRTVFFEVKEDETGHLCMCKQSKNPPDCDGTYATLKEAGILQCILI